MTYTADDVASWKAEFTNVYTISIKGVDYIFRELTYEEYDKCIAVERQEDTAEAEDVIVETALLHPVANFKRIPAGVISTLAEEVLEISCFGAPKYAREVLEQIRESRGAFRDLMKAFVLATMPMYREEELDKLTFRQLANKLALAEQIIRVNQNAFGSGENDIRLDLVDPEEEQERIRQEAEKHNMQKLPGTATFDDPIAQKLRQSLGE